MQEITNYYFKHNQPDLTLMSGLCIPADSDGITRNIRFINCTFHPELDNQPNENCEFIGCKGHLAI